MYRVGDTNAGDNHIRSSFRIVNKGEEAVDLQNVKLRYYYTIDGDKAQEFHCDYAQMGNGNVKAQFVKLDTPVAGADYYMEVSFGPGAGILAPGQDTGEIQTRVNKSDWSNYNESDDFSYDPTKSSYTEWEKAPLYVNDKLVWGLQP